MPYPSSFRFSVVIPTYNRLRYVQRAIKSVLEQTMQPEEIIVIDDGSTDNTANELKKYFPSIKLYSNQKNYGVSHARNRGAEHASGNWLAFLDSDDTWHPTKLEEQAKFLKSRNEIILCHTEEKWIREGKEIKQPAYLDKSDDQIFIKSLQRCIICPSSVIIKKRVFFEIGMFREDLPVCEDYDLWLRTLINYKISYLSSQLVTKYGGHADQLSTQHWGMDRFRIQSLEGLLKFHELNESKLILVYEALIEKLDLLAKGFAKNNKHQEANEFLAKKNAYGVKLDELFIHKSTSK